MLNTILVAVDPADLLPEKELETLGTLRLSPESRAILVHVLPLQDSDRAYDRPTSPSPEPPYQQIEQQLQRYRERLPCSSEIEIVSGDPAEEIVRLSNFYGADLIVIGTRGLTGVARVLEGSVSAEVLEKAACSVLVVRAR